MRIRHRISLTLDRDGAALMRTCGITEKPEFRAWRARPMVPGESVIINVYEDDACWPMISQHIAGRDKIEFVITEFTEAESSAAAYLSIQSTWFHGYPRPANNADPAKDFGYLRVTYEPTVTCPVCYCGLTQVAPFRLKSEPKWGSKSILQLNWVYDEYFVKPEIWHDVFRPLNIGHRPILHHGTGVALKTIVQLDIPSRCNVVDRKRLNCERVCPHCQRPKYLAHCRGPFPAIDIDRAVNIVKTDEYFGSGTAAWRAVIVSQAVYTAIRSHGLKGARFTPIDDGTWDG